MSFSAITEGYAPRIEPVVITHGGKEFHFTAVEISHLKHIEICTIREKSEDWLPAYLVASILDPEGKRMTIEQALKLSKEHAKLFLEAAFKANHAEEADPEKK